MPSIPSLSLTDLNRSISELQTLMGQQPLAVLTRYHRPVFVVMPPAVARQLVQLAAQAARLRQQPDVLQLSEILLMIRQLPLLTEADWLSNCLDHWPADDDEIP